eukprot:1195768-Prorocentrum_minimum.AAC.3
MQWRSSAKDPINKVLTVRPGLRRAGPRALPEDAGAAGGRHGARLPAGGARAGAAHVLQAAAAAAIAHGDTRQLHHRLPLARRAAPHAGLLWPRPTPQPVEVKENGGSPKDAAKSRPNSQH